MTEFTTARSISPRDRSELQLLREEIDPHGQELQRLSERLQTLERDLYLQERRDITVLYCVDFYDLYKYLNHTLRNGTSEQDIDDYIRVLFFDRLDPPAILLPWYYTEFRLQVATLFGSPHEAQRKATLWRDRFRENLETSLKSINPLEDDPTKLLSVLRTISSGIGRSLRAAEMVQRFNALVGQKRLQNLSQSIDLTQKLDLQRDPVYWQARDQLHALRRWKHGPNTNDALALSAISQINRRLNNKVLYLVSSAPSMADVVQHINGLNPTESDQQIQLRGMAYWRLWFALALKTSDHHGNLRPNLEFLQNDVAPKLRQLRRRFIQLRTTVDISLQQGGHNTDSRIGIFRSSFFKELEAFFSLTSTPRLDDTWKSLSLSTDLLGAITIDANDSPLNKLLHSIEEIQSQIEASDADAGKLQELLQNLLDNISILISELKIERLDPLGHSFQTGYSILDDLLDPPYREWLSRIETDGQLAAREVSLELQDMTAESPKETLGLSLVGARAAILCGDFQKARHLLRQVPGQRKGEPEVFFAKALILSGEGNFERAARFLQRALSLSPRSVFRIELADVYGRQFLKKRNKRYLEDALEELDLAEQERPDWPLALRCRHLIVRGFLITACPSLEAFRSHLPALLAEADALLALRANAAFPSRLKEPLLIARHRILESLDFPPETKE